MDSNIVKKIDIKYSAVSGVTSISKSTYDLQNYKNSYPTDNYLYETYTITYGGIEYDLRVRFKLPDATT